MNLVILNQMVKTGGGGGIRTHGTLARTTVFESNQYTVNILLLLKLFIVLHTLLHSHTEIIQDFVGSGGG